MIIAQVTDPHMTVPGRQLPGGYDPRAALAATLARVTGLRPRPALIVFTGDLTENGRPEEFAAFRAAVAAVDLPMVATPGNHDGRAGFAAGLAGSGLALGAGAFLQLALDLGPLRLLCLDTVDEADGCAGLLCEARLAWVARQLAADPRPVLIFMHHPPFATGIGFMDAIGCANSDRLAALVAAAPQVVGIACGHVHRAVATRWAGTVATICPSVAHAVPLDLTPDARPRLEPQRPGFQLHVWEDGRLLNHTEYLA